MTDTKTLNALHNMAGNAPLSITKRDGLWFVVCGPFEYQDRNIREALRALASHLKETKHAAN